MTSSKELYDFYKEYAKWLRSEPSFEFSRYAGLCGNLWDYSSALGRYPAGLCMEMQKQFEEAGLNELLPFNKEIPYSWEVENGVIQCNVLRIKWVLDRVAESSWLYEPKEMP